jgi:nucleoid-associated protein YgaU
MRARLVGLGVLVGTLVFLVGFPVALATVPEVLAPSWSDVTDSLTRPDDGMIVLQLLVVVAAVAYASFVVAFFIEVVAAVRRVSIPRLPGLGWQRRGAAGLVAAIAVLFAAPVAVTATSGPAVTTAAMGTNGDHDQQQHRQQQEDQHGREVTAEQQRHDVRTTYVTQPGDSLWTIAERHLGGTAGDARIMKLVERIAELNRGQPQPEGGALEDSHWIRPGWRLTLPGRPAGETSLPTTQADQTYTVRPGDSLSEIADRLWGDAERWPDLYEANRGVVGGDPDLIRPGQVLSIPQAKHDTEGDAPDQSQRNAATPHTEPPETRDSEAGDQMPEPTPQARASESPAGRGPAEYPPNSTGPATSLDEPGKGEDGDSVLGAPWVLPALTGGGMLLAGALFLGLQQRRRAQFRARRPGRAVAASDAELAPVEMTITAAGAPAAATVEFMDAALRRMAAAHKPGGSMSPLAAVELGDGALTLHLSGEPGEDLPTPWEGTPDRLHWQCRTDVDIDDLGPEPDDVEAPYPLLVTVGTSDDGATWLLNCEELGTLTVTGDPNKSRDFVRHLAAQVAVNPWSRAVTVDCVGVGEETAPLGERIRCHTPGAAGTGVTAEVLADAVAMADRAGRHDVDVTTGRTGRVDGDVWPARMLLVDADTQEPDGLRGLLELVDGQVGRTATSVVVAGKRDDTPGFVLEVTGGGRVRLDIAGLDLAAVGLSGEEARGCGLLYAQSENLADVEVPVDETADEGWQAYADQAGALRREHTLPRNMPTDKIDEPASSILDGHDDEYLRQAAAAPEDLEALAPRVPAGVRDEVERADPTLDQDVADWFSDDCQRPRLSLLGPIGARTRGKALAKRKPYITELFAFLALRRRNGVTLDEICDAFGIKAGRARDYVNTVRYWLGTNPRTGEPHLPHADKSPAAKTRGVNVYQVDDGLLIDADLFRRLRVRGEARGGTEGLRDLIAALELVTGRPFDQQRKGGWSWLAEGERIDEYMTVAISDVAFIVATSCLEQRDVVRARGATELAVLAAPHEEATRLCMVRVAEAEGDRREAERILREEICNRSDDGDAPTELSERTEKIIRAHQWLAT